MAEMEKEAWEQIKGRSLRTSIDPRDVAALEAACQGNGLLDRSGDLGAAPSIMALATEEDLACVLTGGGWSPGTGFVHENLAFVEQARDEWAAFTRAAPKGGKAREWEQFESMSFEGLSVEEVARTVKALAIATPEERAQGAWYELAAALEMDPNLGEKLPAPIPAGEALHRSDYMLLARLQQDCEYYLGYGNRADKHLWAADVDGQIAKMRELYDKLPEKPEWLTVEQIGEYERLMKTPLGSEQTIGENLEGRPADANEARFSISDWIAAEAPLETSLVSVSSDQGYVSVELEQWDRMRADMRDVARASGVDDPEMHTMGQWAARGEAAREALKDSRLARENTQQGAVSKSPAAAKGNAETAAAARSGQSRSTERANPTR